MYFVTSVEEERADAALDGMFKFLAAQENDTIRDRTIRQVEYKCFGNSDPSYPESVGSVDSGSGSVSREVNIAYDLKIKRFPAF